MYVYLGCVPIIIVVYWMILYGIVLALLDEGPAQHQTLTGLFDTTIIIGGYDSPSMIFE